MSESDISRFQSSKDRDDGRTLYEIQFASDNTEYEYEINAKDGEILNYSTENLNNNGNSNAAANGTDAGQTQNNTQSNAQNNTQSNAQNNTQNSGQNNSGTTQNVNVQISEADAKAAALERVPGATEQDLRMELDRDDGSISMKEILFTSRKNTNSRLMPIPGTSSNGAKNGHNPNLRRD